MLKRGFVPRRLGLGVLLLSAVIGAVAAVPASAHIDREHFVCRASAIGLFGTEPFVANERGQPCHGETVQRILDGDTPPPALALPPSGPSQGDPFLQLSAAKATTVFKRDRNRKTDGNQSVAQSEAEVAGVFATDEVVCRGPATTPCEMDLAAMNYVQADGVEARAGAHCLQGTEPVTGGSSYIGALYIDRAGEPPSFAERVKGHQHLPLGPNTLHVNHQGSEGDSDTKVRAVRSLWLENTDDAGMSDPRANDIFVAEALGGIDRNGCLH